MLCSVKAAELLPKSWWLCYAAPWNSEMWGAQTSCWCSDAALGSRAGSPGVNALTQNKTQLYPQLHTHGWKSHLWIDAETEMGSITYSSTIFISVGFALIAHICVLCNFLLSRVLLRPTSSGSVKTLSSELSLNLTTFCFKLGWPHHMQFQILLCYVN